MTIDIVPVLGYPPEDPEPDPRKRAVALTALAFELLVLLSSNNPAAVLAAGLLAWALRCLLEGLA